MEMCGAGVGPVSGAAEAGEMIPQGLPERGCANRKRGCERGESPPRGQLGGRHMARGQLVRPGVVSPLRGGGKREQDRRFRHARSWERDGTDEQLARWLNTCE